MAFSNQNSSIITDSMGNLYNFLLHDKAITLIYFDKLMGNVEKKIIEKNCREEFYSIIDKNDNVYLVYQEVCGDIKLLSFIKGMKQSEIIESNLESKVYNLRIIDNYDDIHCFYCIPNTTNNGQFKTYHCHKKRNKWSINEIKNISIYDILNPVEVIIVNEDLILGYYDLVNGVEQLFVKRLSLSSDKWGQEIQLTSSPNKKLYFDILFIDGDIHVTYSESFESNYIIKYERFRLNQNKSQLVYSHTLSNPSNCTHPTLVKYQNKLWNIWVEHESVISAFSENFGEGWSDPYLWNESKRDIFNRYKFSSNDTKVKRIYKLNYSFGKQYPDIAFLGFGSLNETTKIPLKYRENSTMQERAFEVKKTDYKEKELDDVYSTYYKPQKTISKSIKPIEREHKQITSSIEELRKDIDKIRREINNMNDEINDLQKAYKGSKESGNSKSDNPEDFKKLSNRVEQIEDYLTRRRRGLFQR